MDIVTIICRRDLNQALLQARSIRLFFDRAERGQVMFICNELSQPLMPGELRPIADELPAITFLHGKDLLALRGDLLAAAPHLLCKPNVGWYTQQVLKLAASRLVTSDFYLILDAKNHFVRPVSRGALVADDGRALATMGPPSRMKTEVYRVWRNCFDYLGLDPFASDSIRPVTPFVVRKDLACALIEYMEAREDAPFADAMLSRMPNVYEFLLLQAFVVYRHGGLDRLYKNSPPFFETLFHQAVGGDEAFDEAMRRADGDGIIALGVHCSAERLMTLDQRRRIATYWQRRGLVASPQEGFAMMGWDGSA